MSADVAAPAVRPEDASMDIETTFKTFRDRRDGGRQLAGPLWRYAEKRDAIVIGLPRGGVVTAAALAECLDLPLDVLVVRKLGTPGQEELAMGAIGPGAIRVLNADVIAVLHISPAQIDAETRREQFELDRRERLYRGDRGPLDLEGRTVIVVDDGLATGSTMEAALAVIRAHHPGRIVLAVPVAPADTLERLRAEVDEVVCLMTPEPFVAVGYRYKHFPQVEDREVVRILARAARPASPVSAGLASAG